MSAVSSVAPNAPSTCSSFTASGRAVCEARGCPWTCTSGICECGSEVSQVLMIVGIVVGVVLFVAIAAVVAHRYVTGQWLCSGCCGFATRESAQGQGSGVDMFAPGTGPSNQQPPEMVLPHAGPGVFDPSYVVPTVHRGAVYAAQPYAGASVAGTIVSSGPAVHSIDNAV